MNRDNSIFTTWIDQSNWYADELIIFSPQAKHTKKPPKKKPKKNKPKKQNKTKINTKKEKIIYLFKISFQYIYSGSIKQNNGALEKRLEK